jgi:hypothetical protein
MLRVDVVFLLESRTRAVSPNAHVTLVKLKSCSTRVGELRPS